MSISRMIDSISASEMSEPIALCIGWDVGGWHGRKDGLAVLALFNDGTVQRVGRCQRAALGDMVYSGILDLEQLLGLVGMLPEIRWPRIVIGIDAPLGLPCAFVESSASRLTDNPARIGRLPATVVENRLAYRDTERAVCAEYRPRFRKGWRPLSPSFDGMGSNISKARRAAAQLRTLEPELVRVVPFEADTTAVAVIEVYPALWNALRSDELDPSVAAVVGSAKSEPLPDVRDGVLCALAAACYERTLRDMKGRPQVTLPPDNELVTREGWIYAPRLIATVGTSS
jgi:hypothetical protein